MNLIDGIETLKGVGDKTSALYNKLNIYNIEDLLNFYPRCYLNYAPYIDIKAIKVGERVAIRAYISSRVTSVKVKRFILVSMNVKDNTGMVNIVWFNSPFLKNVFKPDDEYIFVGTVIKKKGKLVMEHPEYYTVDKYKEMLHSLVPVYNLTEGLSNNMVKKCIKQVISLSDNMKEYLPMDIIEKYSLMTYKNAVEQVHFPVDYDSLKNAKRRLVFDEFFCFLAAMDCIKDGSEHIENSFRLTKYTIIDKILSNLPYDLTNAQLKALDDIKDDMSSNHIMNRLIQGDVGSGKTIIAILSMAAMAKEGYQSALMAPTEVLAKQHFDNINDMLLSYGIRVDLLTGSMSIVQKRKVYERLKNGDTDIVIGTHALLEDKVEFNKLGLVITDEQHRFGVKQREKLTMKGKDVPHILVMSATPIPRTLAIILYGDLDISVIDEMPKNRLPIKNCVVDTSYRPKAYTFIGNQVKMRKQVYVVCPMVAQSESMDVENVQDYAEELKAVLDSDVTVTCLHGKMSAKQKETIMKSFNNHEIDVLVSTTVIEVGIDNPNATVMMIENAERFGLAQLHQLRGRVGRGKDQSYCIMVCGKEDEETMERLNVLKESNDGFFIANEDMRLRGQGDFFGVNQSGDMNFGIGDIIENKDELIDASLAVKDLHSIGFDFRNIDNKKISSRIGGFINL